MTTDPRSTVDDATMAMGSPEKTGGLIHGAITEASRLVSAEIQLAKQEIAEFIAGRGDGRRDRSCGRFRSDCISRHGHRRARGGSPVALGGSGCLRRGIPSHRRYRGSVGSWPGQAHQSTASDHPDIEGGRRMGETADDTRREIEESRRQLGATLATLRERTVVVRGHVVRVALIGGAAAAGAASLVVATVLVVRSRRGGPITRAAKHLPAIAHDAVLPGARFSDRWLNSRTQAARRQREAIIEELSARIAENQAQAQRRANPLWRRAAGTALETAASVGVAALVRRAMSERTSRRADAGDNRSDTELVGSNRSDNVSETEFARLAHAES